MREQLTIPRLSPTLSFWLDFVRGVAAVMVLLGHARTEIFGNYAPDFSGAPDVVVKAFFVLFGQGHQAVMAFFVMSGLLIAPKFLGTRALDGAYLRDYVIARLARIWAVAIPALLLSFVVAHATMRAFGASISFWTDRCAPPASDLFYNAIFANKAFTDTICSNDPYWSIHNEMMYYLLWPALIYMIFCRTPWLRLATGVFAIGLTAALVAFDPFDLHHTLSLFALWIAGGLCLAAPRPAGGIWLWGIVTAVGVLGTNLVQWHWTIEALMVAVPLLAFFRVVQETPHHVPAAIGAFFAWLARISFSLYLTHIIIVNLVATYLEYGLGHGGPFRSFTVESVSIFSAVIAATIAFAHLFYWLFERRTDVLKRGMLSLFARRKPA